MEKYIKENNKFKPKTMLIRALDITLDQTCL